MPMQEGQPKTRSLGIGNAAAALRRCKKTIRRPALWAVPAGSFSRKSEE